MPFYQILKKENNMINLAIVLSIIMAELVVSLALKDLILEICQISLMIYLVAWALVVAVVVDQEKLIVLKRVTTFSIE